jgi:hypothetical protein
MGDTTLKFITKGFWVVIVLFIARCFISEPISLYDYFGFAGESIGVALILMGLYERWLWQLNPLEKIPKIKGEYSGYIEYGYNGSFDKKETTIKITQSLLSINVKITTDEIISNTIASTIVFENGEHVLYYTYITNPKSKYSKDNPIQHGTCRMIIGNKTELQGTYWTKRQTIGDIYLKRK